MLVMQTTPNASVALPYFSTHSRSLQQQATLTTPVYQLAGQSTEINARAVHSSSDGVGVALFGLPTPTNATTSTTAPPEAPLLVFKQVEGLATKPDVFTHLLQQRLPHSVTTLAHVREATQGSLKLENTHPFSFTLTPTEGGRWAMAANGTVKITPRQYTNWVDDERLLRPRLPENDSDTLAQVLLNAMLDAMDSRAVRKQAQSWQSPLESDTVVRGILTRFNEVLALQRPSSPSPFNAKELLGQRRSGHPPSLGGEASTTPESRYRYQAHQNVILTNGQSSLVIVHEHPLWYRFEYAPTDTSTPTAVIFASEPTDIAEYYTTYKQQYPATQSRWQQVPNNTAIRSVRTPAGLRLTWFGL